MYTSSQRSNPYQVVDRENRAGHTNHNSRLATDNREQDEADRQAWDQVGLFHQAKREQDEDRKLWRDAGALLGKSASRNEKKALISLLVMVKTGPTYFERRETVRSLWLDRCRRKRLIPPGASARARHAASLVNVSCLFVTGQSPQADVRRKVDAEVHSKGDLFSAPVPDGYATMTTKTQWILLWSLLDSSRWYDYVLLIDDDAFVAFTNFLPWLVKQPRKRFYAGHQHYERNVYRCEDNPTHPNCVYRDMYPADTYPPFASGFGYIMSRDVVKQSVLRAIVRTKRPGLPGNVEDAMLGVLMEEAGVAVSDQPGFVHWIDESGNCQNGDNILLIGNAPENVLRVLRSNEENNRDLCTNVNG